MCNDAAQDAIEMFAFYHMERKKTTSSFTLMVSGYKNNHSDLNRSKKTKVGKCNLRSTASVCHSLPSERPRNHQKPIALS